jgi:hypothetical protein
VAGCVSAPLSHGEQRMVVEAVQSITVLLQALGSPSNMRRWHRQSVMVYWMWVCSRVVVSQVRFPSGQVLYLRKVTRTTPYITNGTP